MEYIKLTVRTNQPDLLIARLSSENFTGFEYNTDGFIAYAEAESWPAERQQALSKRMSQHALSWETLPSTNWNVVWENQFDPVEIRSFCRIRAHFHPSVSGFQHEITIQPQMTFGTGHHATTYMMLSFMEHMDFKNKSVFDFGCGTGILAIMAERLGAKDVFGIDIEEYAAENANENAVFNDAASARFAQGTLETVSGDNLYDVILANLNRNVILRSLERLHALLKAEGVLLISGILNTDRKLVLDAAKYSSYKVLESKKRGDWICVKLVRA